MLKNKETALENSSVKAGKTVLCAFILLFIIASIIFINPQTNSRKTKIHSSQLMKSTEKSKDKLRTDYFDKDGRITVASDLGYATIIVTSEENRRLEQYYNESGEPVRLYSGFYSILREFDKSGNNNKITYLDQDGNPCTNIYGYAMEKREYNTDGHIVAIKYYDTKGEPVCTNLYGYGRINEYDKNGNRIKITYIDDSEKPMTTGQGYASVIYHVYHTDGPENGKTESEFYTDEEGNPVALSLGQYGIHIEYNESGQGSVITYLDMNGKPIITNKGYTAITRTFHADNSVAIEQYYDIDGNPFSLTDGQYGIMTEGGQVTYLDKNGVEIFNIRRFLYNYSQLVIPLALLFVGFSAFAGRKQNIILLIVCVLSIIYMTLMFRDGDLEGYSGSLRYYRRILFDSRARADIIKNIWLFIPLGAVLYRLYPKTTVLLVPIALSALIEGIQLFAGIGTCEMDDIISNGLGGWIGFCMGRLATDIRLIINKRKQQYSA